MRQEGLNRGTALWSAVLSVVRLLQHRDHSLCLRCRVCWFFRMKLRVFTLGTISERRFYIIFHAILPEFYLAVQKEEIQSKAKPKGIEAKCLMWEGKIVRERLFSGVAEMVARPYLSAEPKWWKGKKAGLYFTVQLYWFQQKPVDPLQTNPDHILLKLWIIRRKKNYTLQSIILKVLVLNFLKIKYTSPASPFFQVFNLTAPLGTCRLIFLYCVAHSLTFAVLSPFRSSFKLFFCSISTL